MNPKRKWFTCAPVRFKGNQMFFSRDSGLLCKGFQELGIECKAILPGPPMDDDQVSDLIRTDYSNLEDPNWWASLGGDGVVFYGWGSGKYLRIARAIKQAGMLLVTHMDTGGMISILNGPLEYSKTLWRVTHGEKPRGLTTSLLAISRIIYNVSIGFALGDLTRSLHLKNSDLIGVITPEALGRIRKVCQAYGGPELADRVILLPHPIAPYTVPAKNTTKQRLIIAAGRWDDERVKGTDLLIETLSRVISTNDSVAVEIFGQPSSSLTTWHDNLPVDLKDRVALMGRVPNTDVTNGMKRAIVCVCTSLRESFHIVSAEALCCGCSVVGCDTPETPSMKWFAQEPHGTLTSRNASALSEGILNEISAWDRGERDPNAISLKWRQLLHAPQIAKKVLENTMLRSDN